MIAPVRIGWALTLATIAYVCVGRPWLLRWGTTSGEVDRQLPGDDLVPGAHYLSTRAITIAAPSAEIWPWLVQLGQGRGGFYTYDRLERFVGAAIHSADKVLPEYQGLAVGDTVRLSPVGGPTVVRLDPQRALVLHDTMDVLTGRSVPLDGRSRFTFEWSWAFVLRPVSSTSTRLIVRTRVVFRPPPLRAAAILLLEPIHFVMERGTLQGIQRRVETRTAVGAHSVRTADGEVEPIERR